MTGVEELMRIPATAGRDAEPPACEVCGVDVAPWPIADGCVLWRCPSCAHVMRDLALCRANAREHPWGGDDLFDRIRARLTLRTLTALMPSSAPLDVFEIGFGRGLILGALLDRGHRVAGTDPGMLELGPTDRLRRDGRLLSVAAESLPASPRSYDVVYAIHVVEHLVDPAAVFRWCRESLRPGGFAYFMTPDAGSKGLELFRDAWWNLEDPTHVRFFSRASIGRALHDAGFDVVSVRTPRWDSLSLEVSSALRVLRRRSGEHGVLSSKATMPVYAALVPVAAALRVAWPAIAPSMEVVARATTNA